MKKYTEGYYSKSVCTEGYYGNLKEKLGSVWLNYDLVAEVEEINNHGIKHF